MCYYAALVMNQHSCDAMCLVLTYIDNSKFAVVKSIIFVMKCFLIVGIIAVIIHAYCIQGWLRKSSDHGRVVVVI